jgi:hypothetical protein
MNAGPFNSPRQSRLWYVAIVEPYRFEYFRPKQVSDMPTLGHVISAEAVAFPSEAKAKVRIFNRAHLARSRPNKKRECRQRWAVVMNSLEPIKPGDEYWRDEAIFQRDPDLATSAALRPLYIAVVTPTFKANFRPRFPDMTPTEGKIISVVRASSIHEADRLILAQNHQRLQGQDPTRPLRHQKFWTVLIISNDLVSVGDDFIRQPLHVTSRRQPLLV